MLYIFLATIFYSASIIFITFASRILNTTLVAAIVNIVSAILPALVVIPVLNKVNIHDQKLALIAAIIGGILIALFGIALSKSYSLNKVAVVVPIVFGGSILISTILGSILFKEKVSLIQGLGLSLLGVALLIIIYARFTGK